MPAGALQQEKASGQRFTEADGERLVFRAARKSEKHRKSAQYRRN